MASPRIEKYDPSKILPGAEKGTLWLICVVDHHIYYFIPKAKQPLKHWPDPSWDSNRNIITTYGTVTKITREPLTLSFDPVIEENPPVKFSVGMKADWYKLYCDYGPSYGNEYFNRLIRQYSAPADLPTNTGYLSLLR